LATTSVEDYLERIYDLIQAKGYARAVDIAKQLKIRQPSVTKMIQRLHEQGFVVYAKYRGLTLTDRGVRLARSVKFRHETLLRFLNMLGLTGDRTLSDVEGIEHHCSRETIARIARFVDFLESRPDVLRRFHRRDGRAGPDDADPQPES
jgi:Mn-dependent DtxR family transcriptional regulator